MRPTRVYRLEVLVIDHDDIGPDEVASVLANVRYPNDCIRPRVVRSEAREIEWSDDHPLNQRIGWLGAYEALFASEPNVTKEK